MDAIERLNRQVATTLGWFEFGDAWRRADEDGLVETASDLPPYTENLLCTWRLVEFAAEKKVEFSLFMMMYDRTPLWMASFIRGMKQRTSTGACPKIATCKAFVMMFAPTPDDKKLPY